MFYWKLANEVSVTDLLLVTSVAAIELPVAAEIRR
jgi:hypothetical protein